MTITSKIRATDIGVPCETSTAHDQMAQPALATVIPLRRTVPCASGSIFDIGIEIHLAGPVGRAALALHELHDLADEELAETGDPMLALVGAADELIDRLSAEHFDDVSIALGVALSPVGRAALRVQGHHCETTVLVHRNELRLALSTSSRGEGSPIATVSRPSASASLRSARLALNAPATERADHPFAVMTTDAFLIEADGTLHELVV